MRYYSFFIFILWLITPIDIFAAKRITIKGVQYESGADNTATAALTIQAKGEVTILESIELGKKRYQVVQINEAYFKKNNNITGIVLPGTVKTIKTGAFRGCSKLKNLKIPQGILIEDGTYDMSKGIDVEYFAVPNVVVNDNQIKKYENPKPEPKPVPEPMPVKDLVSDVDINIPQTCKQNEETFAIIIANENYQEEAKVEYALNDGEMFKEYCHKVMGIPEENVHIRKDATLNNIKAELSWMQQVADAYDGEARFIVFYAGHGVPDEKSAEAYLLPVDGKGTMLDTGYSLAKLYETLGNMPAERVTVFMDACFSGSKRGDGMLASARGVAIRAKAQAPQGKMVVFSAAQGDETAYPYKEKGHGLFTYYLLKKLKETKGSVTYGELSDYLQTEVKRKSIVANSKGQTPTVSASSALGGNWKKVTLK